MRENTAAATIRVDWPITSRQAPDRSPEAKHEPMHVNMFRRVTLTEDVGALEMMKRNFDFSSDRRGIGGAQLSLVRISGVRGSGSRFAATPRGGLSITNASTARKANIDKTTGAYSRASARFTSSPHLTNPDSAEK